MENFGIHIITKQLKLKAKFSFILFIKIISKNIIYKLIQKFHTQTLRKRVDEKQM